MTENGYWMHVDLGKKFRSYYIDQLNFLSETLVNEELYIRSTGKISINLFILYFLIYFLIYFLFLTFNLKKFLIFLLISKKSN